MLPPRLPNPDRRFGRWVFAGVVALFAITWLALLPRLAREPDFSEAFSRVEAQGIDSGALFYTDHPRALQE